MIWPQHLHSLLFCLLVILIEFKENHGILIGAMISSHLFDYKWEQDHLVTFFFLLREFIVLEMFFVPECKYLIFQVPGINLLEFGKKNFVKFPRPNERAKTRSSSIIPEIKIWNDFWFFSEHIGTVDRKCQQQPIRFSSHATLNFDKFLVTALGHQREI